MPATPSHTLGSALADRATACVAFDYGGTISTSPTAGTYGSRPVNPDALPVLQALAGRGVRLVLASNTLPGYDRRPALTAACIEHLFATILQSHELGFGKPSRQFFATVASAAACAPHRVIFAGNNLQKDIEPAVAHGMRAVLVRPGPLNPGEHLPVGAVRIRHVRELPGLLEEIG
jgi:FMN phosphatase YigB (HAD superfamily)